MTIFRPCIDIHDGRVKQIVGGTLEQDSGPQTNFISDRDPAWYADLYRRDDLRGGHVISLGPGNEATVRQTLSAWPGGFHLGGGITPSNAPGWLAGGAQKVIVTSWLFADSALDMGRVAEMASAVTKECLVIDLSCRRVKDGWRVAANRWRTVTDTLVNAETLQRLSEFCSEYLVHAADVEGRCQGIDADLVTLLGAECPIPCTYAGGANRIDDLDTVERLSCGRVDLTFGSALDLFGGQGVRYDDCVQWNRIRAARNPV